MNTTRCLFASLLGVIALLFAVGTSEAALNFATAPQVQCGQVLSGDTGSSNNNNDTYGANFFFNGPDVIYRLDVPTATDVSITGTGDFVLLAGLHVFVLNAPNPNALVAGSPLALNPLAPNGAINIPNAQGTYYIVVDGNFGTDGEFELTISCASFDCTQAQALSCGSRITGNTSGASNKGQSYPCVTGFGPTGFGGPDNLYTFSTTQTSDVVVEISNYALTSSSFFDTGVATLLNACNTQSCLAFVRLLPFAGGTITAPNLPPGTYYIVIDSPSNTTQSYNLEIQCIRLDCTAATPLNCGDVTLIDNQNRTSQSPFYSCNAVLPTDWTGGERIMALTITNTTDVYVNVDQVRVNGFNAQLGFFLLSSCSVNSCIASGFFANGQIGQLAASNVAPGTYYLVMDSTTPQGGVAQIEVLCCRAGEPCKVTIEEINAKNFPEIEVRARVTDLTNKFVQGLDEQDFLLFEDNIVQNITVEPLECGTGIPVSIAVVMDTSGSMDGQPMIDAKQGAVDLINILQPSDRACTVRFDASTRLLQAFTDNKPALRTSITTIPDNPGGGETNMHDGAYMGVDNVKNETNNRFVFIFSDGAANGSETYTADDVIRYANQNQVTIYSIGIGTTGGGSLERMATQTGGAFYSAPNASQLGQIYTDLYLNLKRFYLIRYVTTNAIADATTRNVRLCVNSACDTDTYVAQPSCLVIGNYKNHVSPSTYFVTPTTAVGQRFINTGFQAVNLSNAIEVELFFENDKSGQVRVSLHRDGPGGTSPGTLIAQNDGGPVTIECPGWFNFKFFNTPISFDFPRYYWIVVEHAGGENSVLRYNRTGPEDGAARRNNGTWAAVNANEDIFYRIYCCPCSNLNTPTPTPTMGNPTPTPTPTCRADVRPPFDQSKAEPRVGATVGRYQKISGRFHDPLYGFDPTRIKLFMEPNGVNQQVPLTLELKNAKEFNMSWTPTSPLPLGWVAFRWSEMYDLCNNQTIKRTIDVSYFVEDGGNVTPTFTPTQGNTNTPTNTPGPGTPTDTPTPTPTGSTPTPTPTVAEVRIDIDASFEPQGARDIKLDMKVVNSTTNTYPVALYVAVEVAGTFYFYPNYTESAVPVATLDLPPIDTGWFNLITVNLPDPISPPITVTWYAAFVNTNTGQLEGNLASSPMTLE